MIRILDIALKDLRQLMRERETFLFLLLMPIIFTLLFGYAFGGFSSGESDARLPIGYLDEDGSPVSLQQVPRNSALVTVRVTSRQVV